MKPALSFYIHILIASQVANPQLEEHEIRGDRVEDDRVFDIFDYFTLLIILHKAFTEIA